MAEAVVSPHLISYTTDQPFFLRLAALISGATVFAFAQAAVRGISDPFNAPAWVHVHALAMLAWLGVFVIQNHLAAENIRLHRKIGVAATVLAIAMLPMGWLTSVKTIELHR